MADRLMEPLVAAAGVTRTFGSFTAVDHVDLRVDRGEIVGLLGANGAGKTTLVRLVLGLLAPTAGRVEIFGLPPSRSGRRRLGYVPQGLGLYEDLTPGENLAFARAVYGTGASRRAARPAERLVGELPVGAQRTAAFAQALDHGPELLVLDEPTSGVGPLAGARLWDTVRRATEEGAGALVTTHNLEEAEQCDRLVVMAEGRVVASGTVEEVVDGGTAVVVVAREWVDAFEALQRSGLPAVLVGSTLRLAGVGPDDVRRSLAGLDAEVREAPVTLEERFLELAGPGGMQAARPSGKGAAGAAGAGVRRGAGRGPSALDDPSPGP
ncbi:MAG TPA: ABC transporter ATP-binding protein [Acidimicrobiales bacterium]|nr:ABC transporter ATP-binding protein [Acidimicrobiales bacterium]